MQPTSLPFERKVLAYVSEATIKHKLNGLNDDLKNHHVFFFYVRLLNVIDGSSFAPCGLVSLFVQFWF